LNVLRIESAKDTFDKMPSDRLRQFHDKWQRWMVEGKQWGWMLDASTALKTEGRVVNPGKVVRDGPFVEPGDEIVRGYVNVEADTLDSAAELAKDCPVPQHGGIVEIRPFWEGIPGIS
jgi:hypothetical protein